MKQLPMISVIVPVYRVEQYLDKCVSSILSQTYDNLEVLLVDDGSPDGSGAICDRWAERDSRVRVFHQANAGGGAARNKALDNARGELIAFVDSDDYIAPDMFEYLYSLLQQGADIAECSFLETEDDDACFGESSEPVRWYSAEEAMVCHIQDTIFQQLIWNKLYRREMVEGIRFPLGTKIDDEFFTYRLLGNANRLARSERVCYAYRQQASSVMHQQNPVKKLEGLRAKCQRLEFLKSKFPSLVEMAKIELMLACLYALQAFQGNTTESQKKEAVLEIRRLIHDLRPLDLSQVDSGKQKLLLKAAVRQPVAVAKMLNFLIKIHVLK